ncbi:hypothetical protein GCM10010363_71970 [Streptomyces omiyaensis]|nr:hypothetical protein GCM10010363_71970 [Streptomyces omiyaensis]
MTGPGRVLMSPDDRGADRDEPVEAAFGVCPGERAVKTFFQVPSTARFRNRSWAPFHEPKCSSGSIDGVPVRYSNAIASITWR